MALRHVAVLLAVRCARGSGGHLGTRSLVGEMSLDTGKGR